MYNNQDIKIMNASTYDRLNSACAEKGISLNEVCRMANIDRSILERWKKREPKTLRTLRALEEAIAKKAAVAEAPAIKEATKDEFAL